MLNHLRIARPASDLQRTITMYSAGLGLRVLGSFEDHAGFDGVMLGTPGMSYHLEFTQCQHHPVHPSPTSEDLLVFYLPDELTWHAACANMLAANFRQVASFNPYWETHGRTFEDADGYRVVLQHGEWNYERQRQ